MPIFEAENISCSLKQQNKTAALFSEISFSLQAGEIYDLVGPSGAGKSTLLRICARMLPSDSGVLRLRGKASSAFAPVAWRRQVCLVPQQPSLVLGCVRDNLLLPWTLEVNKDEKPPTDEVLVGLIELAGLEGISLTRDAAQLSGGQAARVALLRSFVTRPSVLLLDEVDAALDEESAGAIGRLTRALVGENTACLRIRHRPPDGFASGVFSLHGGVLTFAERAPQSALTPNALSVEAAKYAQAKTFFSQGEDEASGSLHKEESAQ